ncbi:predicted protein [Histoplasma capsulatum var. duboisii H88]|uniref:Predicted protein n=1 Tax=Ajellomyces capsulatus (strain H88) TaxID=544711 RepID=F0UTR4_AJEC8|nr:predicted protein [Histoplasma capsulatum var. duboisii H88]
MTKTLFAEESSDLSFRAPDLSLASRYRQPDSYGDPSWERVRHLNTKTTLSGPELVTLNRHLGSWRDGSGGVWIVQMVLVVISIAPVQRQETRANQEWCVTDVAGGIAEQWRDSGPRTTTGSYVESVEHLRVGQPSRFRNYCSQP